MPSISSTRLRRLPSNSTSMSRSAASTPYANAAARVPPPENVSDEGELRGVVGVARGRSNPIAAVGVDAFQWSVRRIVSATGERTRKSEDLRGSRAQFAGLQPLVDCLPAAAERLVEQHERERRVRGAPRKLVLRLEQAALGVEHRQEAVGAVPIAQAREVRRLLARFRGDFEARLARTRARESEQRVLGLLEGDQDGLLVAQQRGVHIRVRDADVRADASEIERGPAQETARSASFACRLSPRSDAEVDNVAHGPNRETRGKRSAVATPTRAVSACNAYSAKRTSARLRSMPVGSPMSSTCGSGGSSASAANACTNVSGRLAEQHGQPMRAAIDVALERRDARERRLELRSGARDVEVRPAAAVEQRLRELERLPLVLRISLRDRQSVAGAFELEVRSRELRRTITYVSRSASVAALASAVAACTERRTRPKKSSSQVTSSARVIEPLVAVRRERDGRALVLLERARLRGRDRIALELARAEHRARGAQVRLRDPKVVVLQQRRFEPLVQERIVERLPPREQGSAAP